LPTFDLIEPEKIEDEAEIPQQINRNKDKTAKENEPLKEGEKIYKRHRMRKYNQ